MVGMLYAALISSTAFANEVPALLVHKDPNCGSWSKRVQHLRGRRSARTTAGASSSHLTWSAFPERGSDVASADARAGRHLPFERQIGNMRGMSEMEYFDLARSFACAANGGRVRHDELHCGRTCASDRIAAPAVTGSTA